MLSITQIGYASAENKLESLNSTIDYYIGNIGIDLINKNIKIFDGTLILIGFSLGNLGIVEVKNGISIIDVIGSLKRFGLLAAKYKLKDALMQVEESLRLIREKANEYQSEEFKEANSVFYEINTALSELEKEST